MPCHFPMQCYFSVRADGKRDIRPSNVLGRMFRSGLKMPENSMALPCGQCMPCRLERSRQTALRCVHESRMFENSCFITLTYSDDKLKEMCPVTDVGYSLVRKHVQDFIKRLRVKFSRGFVWTDRDGLDCICSSSAIRVFGCGEYGDKTARPHYHFCLFNCHFPDRVYYKTVNGFKYYNSDVLSSIWSFGHCVVGDFSFETAAYVARYCTKKVTGRKAASHYCGRLPEFAVYPTSGGGLGKSWFEKFGDSDVLPTDTCVVRGQLCMPPRYYDKLRQDVDPDSFAKAKLVRVERALLRADDNTYARLRVKEKCMDARIRLLVRNLE